MTLLPIKESISRDTLEKLLLFDPDTCVISVDINVFRSMRIDATHRDPCAYFVNFCEVQL